MVELLRRSGIPRPDPSLERHKPLALLPDQIPLLWLGTRIECPVEGLERVLRPTHPETAGDGRERQAASAERKHILVVVTSRRLTVGPITRAIVVRAPPLPGASGPRQGAPRPPEGPWVPA